MLKYGYIRYGLKVNPKKGKPIYFHLDINGCGGILDKSVIFNCEEVINLNQKAFVKSRNSWNRKVVEADLKEYSNTRDLYRMSMGSSNSCDVFIRKCMTGEIRLDGILHIERKESIS